MPKQVNYQNINEKRMQIKSKGYITRAESAIYLGLSTQKGRAVYDELKKNLEANGVKVNACGISPNVFNEYLGITNEEIYNNYKMGY